MIRSVREEAENLLREAKALLEAAKDGAGVGDRTKTILAAPKVLEILGRITGELTAAVDVKVVLDSPRIVAERRAIVEALLPYHEAAAAVAAALRVLDT